jgi:hypothetical protein
MARSLRRQEKAPRRARGSVTVYLPVCLIVLLGRGCTGHVRRRLRVSDPQRRQRLLVLVEEVVPLRVPCPLVESW